jgi:hypothetical protein
MFAALNGDEQDLARKSGRPLSPDFLLGDIDQLVELDEPEHITTARLRTLDFYLDYAAPSFDLTECRRLCEASGGAPTATSPTDRPPSSQGGMGASASARTSTRCETSAPRCSGITVSSGSRPRSVIPKQR